MKMETSAAGGDLCYNHRSMEMEQQAEEEQISGRLIPFRLRSLPAVDWPGRQELSEKENLMNHFWNRQKLRWEAMYDCSLF